MIALCAACETPVEEGTLIGSLLFCKKCKPAIISMIEAKRAKEMPVNIGHIARKYFQDTQEPRGYPLRDVPGTLWLWAQIQAKTEGSNVRSLILRALYEYQENHKETS